MPACTNGNGGLRLRIDKVESALQALAIFEDIAGMTAEEAAELTSAKQAQGLQDGQLATN